MGRRRPGLAVEGLFHERLKGLDSVALYGELLERVGGTGL